MRLTLGSLTQSGQVVFFRLNKIKHLISKQKGRAELSTELQLFKPFPIKTKGSAKALI